jgi:CubicO group peptidase (beta-lactamase class C family)
MRVRSVALAMLCAVSVLSAQQELPADFDAFVEGVMAEHGVPGIALAIVKDGKVIRARGYGVKTLGTGDSVDAHTLFGIASNTKAFTATALGLLVEEGVLGWEDKVIDHLSWFRMSDPYVTAELTVRDLLVHRSGLGLGAGDLLFWPTTTFTRREIVERLRYVPLATSFRSAYAYDNVLYSVAGEMLEAITGKTWEEFVTERILGPVGMADARIHRPGIDKLPNISSTHAEVEGTIQLVTPFSIDNSNPAGGINASATDMSKWLMVQLDSGRVSGSARLFKPATTRQLWELVTPMPQIRAPAAFAPFATQFNGYALGFNVRDYRGHKLVTHTGGLPGFISRVAMIPDQKLGIAVLTNHESRAMEPITWTIVDHIHGAEHDWRGAYKTLAENQRANAAKRNATTEAARNTSTRPSLPLGKYAARYVDPWYGGITITEENGGLVMRFEHTPVMVGDLEHWQYETFRVKWHKRELRADAFVTFTLDPTGRIAEARMAPASPDVDFSYDFAHLRLVPEQ